MDISAFSEENFDVKEWINKTFREVETQENKEVLVSSMVSKLQLYVQQVNSALEETTFQMLRNVPRVIEDAKVMAGEVLVLKEKMEFIKKDIARIEKDRGDSMAVVEKLDKMKTVLQTAKQSLHEADNWTVLATEIEDVFESHDIDAIASKVVSMQQSLKVLASSVDYEERRLQLEGFKNKLEAIASPPLVKAFTNNNINESKKFVSIFISMGRLAELVKYYEQCQCRLLCEQWSSLVNRDQDHGVAEWLKAFYDLLLDNWHTQVKWCQEVFGSWEMLPKIYCEVLALKEVSTYIETALKQHSDQLPFLIQLKDSTHKFATNLKQAIVLHGGVDKATWLRVCQVLYTPYTKYIRRYGELEEKHCSVEQASSQVASSGDLVDSVQSLGQATPRVITICRHASQRCQQFTHATAYPALVQAIQFCLLKHLDQYKSILRQIDLEKQNKDEWTMFRVCLTLLQNAGELLLEIDEFERGLVEDITTSRRKSREEEVDMKTILLSKEGQEEYSRLIEKISSGETLLDTVVKRVGEVCYRGYKTMFDTMFRPLASQLDSARTLLANLSTSSQAQPDYSYAPQEYITQIGEYMMTLPQHLEPFVLNENPGLSKALVSSVKTSEGAEQTGPADLLLGAVARHTSAAFTDLILSISYLSPHASKQLSIDIGYLGNVLEDLGFSLSDNLSQLLTLLKLAPESFQAQSTGCSPKLVATVRHMRNITSS